MHSEKWRRRTLPGLRSPSSSSSFYESSSLEPDVMEHKKPRVLSKALRSLSNSSMESLTPMGSRTSLSSRRLSKSNSGSASGSMIERIHRRVSKDSPVTGSPPERPGSPLSPPNASMEIYRHGPLKADVSLLKARCEYLVLTDYSLVKFGSAEAARTAFPQVNQASDSTTAVAPVSSGAKHAAADARIEIPLRSIVASFNEEGSSPRFGIEVWWSSPWPKLAYCKTHFFFTLPKERDSWLADIQRACRIRLRRSPVSSIIPENLKARIDHIVDTTEPTVTDGSSHNLTFPVAKRILGLSQKGHGPEDTQNVIDGSSFYLVIGPCMCYFLEVLKADHTTLPGELRVKSQSFGTVTLTRFKASVASQEQRFVMSFRYVLILRSCSNARHTNNHRQPFNYETRLELASTHYRRIIESLTKVDRILKPMWPQHFQQLIFDIKGLPPPLQLTSGNDLGGLERSLQAYCAAFHVQVPRWNIEWSASSQPVFRLFPSEGQRYTPLQLLAVFRALRYNSYFKGLSFRDVDLSALVGKTDYSHYGDSVVLTSLNGRSIHC